MNAPQIHLVMACIFFASARAVDCAGSASTCAANPIHVTFVIHFDPLPTMQGEVPRSAYEAERDNLAWLADYLDALEKERTGAFVPRLTLEMAGDHAEWYIEDDVGLELLGRLYRKGFHCFGTHFHRNLRQAPHVWRDAASPESSALVTSEHIAMVDRLVGKIIGSDDPKRIRAANRTITGHYIDLETAANAGFDTMTGGRNEAMNLFFDHDVYNPWRPADGWPLGEDLDSRWILVPQAPVLGQIGEHAPIPAGVPDGYTRGMRGMIWQDLSVPAMRRKFLHLYLERRNAREDRVWIFGWHEHTSDLFPADGRRGARNFRSAVTGFVEWLNANFIGGGNPDGRPAVRYSNTDEVRDAFLSWERARPNRSSFSYEARSCDWEKYPYRLRGLAWALICSHHEREIDYFKKQGVHAHRLMKAPDRDWYLEGGQVKTAAPPQEIYLLWSDRGEVTIDFGQFASGRLQCIAGSGARSMVDAGKLLVGSEPIVVHKITETTPTRETAIGPTPIQFRLNVNHCHDDAAAIENCKLLRRHMELFTGAGARASYWFTGLAADQVNRLDPSLFGDLIERGMPIGHHGANRPPNPQPIHRVHGDDWSQDVAAMVAYESFAIDPESGRLDPARAGGLKMLQQLAGGRVKATGRFFQASILLATKRLGCESMIGLKENTGAPTDAGWFLGMKGMPDTLVITPRHLRRQTADPERLYEDIDNFIQRRRPGTIESIAVLAHDHDFLNPSNRGDHFWNTYERVLRWSASHAKLKVVTFEEILDRIQDDRERIICRKMLLKIADILSKAEVAPPEYITLDDDYFSLADAFQALVAGLDAFGKNGALPEQVRMRDILGPTKYHPDALPVPVPDGGLQEAPIRAADVIAAASGLDLSEEIPWRVSVSGRHMNPATFLRLMASAVANIGSSGQPGAFRAGLELSVLPIGAKKNTLADPLTKLQFWTFKPERPRGQSAPDLSARDAKADHPITFFAVHCEPSTANPVVWDALREFVGMADRYESKLTLMFNPQWAEFILADTRRFERLKSWQTNGHEVAVHYHNVIHGGWNGYTNRRDEQLTRDARYRGSVANATKLLDALARPDLMRTMCMGPDAHWDSTDIVEMDETDYPDGIIYDVDGMDVGLARPMVTEFRGKKLFHLKHHFFAPGHRADHLDSIKAEFRAGCADDVLGVVTHDVDFARSPDFIEEWFKFCRENAAEIQTVRRILDAYPRDKMKEVQHAAQEWRPRH